jgi:hypothetical protein
MWTRAPSFRHREHLVGKMLEAVLCDCGRCPLALVSLWFPLVASENLDRRKPCHAILTLCAAVCGAQVKVRFMVVVGLKS